MPYRDGEREAAKARRDELDHAFERAFIDAIRQARADTIRQARIAALEEAERVAGETNYPWPLPSRKMAKAADEMAERIATAIRNLRDEGQGDE